MTQTNIRSFRRKRFVPEVQALCFGKPSDLKALIEFGGGHVQAFRKWPFFSDDQELWHEMAVGDWVVRDGETFYLMSEHTLNALFEQAS